MTRVRALRLLAVIACSGPAAAPLAAQHPDSPSDSLADLEIEELARIRVSSASRRLEPVTQAAAAVFVITRDEIRRAGAGTLPEALRLAPGLQVAAVTARDWSITSRGFAEQSPNKLLVLVDGRAIYSPLFAGVFWDVQDVPLEDVERIEVILGSGATLWGSNAVNGIINVITRPATETRGGLLGLSAGTAQHISATGRYGADLGRPGALRVYGRFLDRAPSRLAASGEPGEDDWQQGQGGFRWDVDATPRDRLTFQGDVYAGSGGELVSRALPSAPFAETVLDGLDAHGANLLGRWIRRFSDTHELQLQSYFDRAVREVPAAFGRVAVNTFDLELQHRFPLARGHDFLWGAGYRLNVDTISGTFTTVLLPNARATHLITAFAQDEITLARDRWSLTLGAKLERNDFSGAELQPDARLLWTPGTRHTLWTAVSRAVRIPSRLDTDVRFIAQVIPGTPPAIVQFDGNEEFDSEELIAWEGGWRGELHPSLSLDLSVYYSWYDRLRSIAPLPVTVADGFVVQPLEVHNDAEGHAWGGTLAASWRAARRVHIRASYTLLDVDVALRDDAPAGSTPNVNPGFNPRHQAAVRSSFTLSGGVEIDAALRYVDELPSPLIPDYLEADARIGWNLRPGLAVALVGRDLFSARHPEFSSLPPREIQRHAELQVEWRF